MNKRTVKTGFSVNDWKPSKTLGKMKQISRWTLISGWGKLFSKWEKLVSRSAQSQSWLCPFNCYRIRASKGQPILIIIHQTHYEKSDWSRAFNQFTTWHDKWNICCRYCIFHVKFNVCLVTKPLSSVLLRNKMAERFASVSEDELCEKCIIKQLLNPVFAWYHELSKPRVCVICLSLRLRQIAQTSVLIIHDIMLNLIQ